jgi:glycine cleavage system H protein
MGNPEYIDIFATKGIEYLVVIVFLVTLIFFFRFLNKPARTVARNAEPERNRQSLIDWFYIAENYFYHQGHSWIRPENGAIVRVGIDDFAQKLIGKTTKVTLPRVGTMMGQGNVGWQMEVDSKSINILSPVNGEVVELNEKVLKSPGIINQDPYSDGWLFKVKVPDLEANKKNLLTGGMVKLWIENTVERLSNVITGNEELVLQDGGVPISGFIREIPHDDWEKFASEFLMTTISK